MKIMRLIVLLFVAIVLLMLMWFTFLGGAFFRIEAVTNLLPPSFILPAIFIFVLLSIVLMGVYYLRVPAREKIAYSIKVWEYRKKNWGLETELGFDKVEGEKVLIPASFSVISLRSFLRVSVFPRTIIVTNKRVLVGVLTLGVKETFVSSVLVSPLSLWHPAIGRIPKTSGKTLSFLRRDAVISEAKFHGVLTKQDDKDWDSVEFRIRVGPISETYRIYSPKAREIYNVFSSPMKT